VTKRRGFSLILGVVICAYSTPSLAFFDQDCRKTFKGGFVTSEARLLWSDAEEATYIGAIQTSQWLILNYNNVFDFRGFDFDDHPDNDHEIWIVKDPPGQIFAVVHCFSSSIPMTITGQYDPQGPYQDQKTHTLP
jgi:hypothetical protein